MKETISDLDSYLDVDEVFVNEAGAMDDVQALPDRLSKRRQVEDLLEKKRLREELADF